MPFVGNIVQTGTVHTAGPHGAPQPDDDATTLSVNTARNHITHLMAKLGVRSRLEAVNVAVRRGLIRFDPPS